MIANRLISISLKGSSFVIKAGAPVPAPVLRHWQATNQVSRLLAQGTITDDTAPAAAKKSAKKSASDTSEGAAD